MHYGLSEISQLIIITASIPWKIWNGCKSCNHVEKRPCYDDAVVNVQEKHQAHGRYSNAFQKWTQLCHQSHSSRSQILTNGYLLKKHWDPTKDHGDEINYEKGTWNGIVIYVSRTEKKNEKKIWSFLSDLFFLHSAKIWGFCPKIGNRNGLKISCRICTSTCYTNKNDENGEKVTI